MMETSTINRVTKTKEVRFAECAIGFYSAGIRLTPREFDAIEDYDNTYRYELIHGVLVVSPIPSPAETDLNDMLGQALRNYQDTHPKGKSLDLTLPEQYIFVEGGRRIADRAIWAGLGRMPNIKKDVPTVGIELVSEGKQDQIRDFIEKKNEYKKAGLQQYWIIDRFDRTMTVFDFRGKRTKTIVVTEDETYESPLLPGFIVPLKRLFETADRYKKK